MHMLDGSPNSTDLKQPLTRLWLLVGGWLLFGLGLIGIALPLLPTTVFWIGAVWCWTRSAPQLSRRILSHPRFGQPVYLFIAYGVMTRPGKWMALSGMTVGYALLHLLSHPDWIVSLSVALILLLAGAWLWQRPEPIAASPTRHNILNYNNFSEKLSSTPPRRGCD
jgi:uncharacterized membrane protein YbaN (DUF454 family)